ncbi:hypothetical protein ONZ51_g8352 [Trametes cubensis]|uniref:Uncharacterized protein n=1 Tax=Trametes cubensis TaxID=1111947 RepID=A0AAD7TPP1_9APHY|nr:hypothetical protein ONZ51_g8352 [Trametes cubensis]
MHLVIFRVHTRTLIFALRNGNGQGQYERASASGPAGPRVQADDFDPNIVYSGPWQAFHDQTYGYNGTRHVATRTGLSANFKFNGSCLIVEGIVGSGGSVPMPPTTFILDGHFTQMNTSVTIGEPFSKAPQYASAVLYIATTISEGPHELIITNLDGNDDTPLILDRFVYTPLPQTSNASSSSVASTSSHTSASASAASSSTVPHSTSPASSPTISSSSHSKTPAIIGGVVAAVCILLLAALGYIAWRRRHTRFLFRKDKNGEDVVSDIRPFAAWRGDAPQAQTHARATQEPGDTVAAVVGNASQPAVAHKEKQPFTPQPNPSAQLASGSAHGGDPPPPPPSEPSSSALQQAAPPVAYGHAGAATGPQQDWLPPIEDFYDSKVQAPPPEYTP